VLSTPVQAAADLAARLTGARRALLAVFAGAISVLAFAPIHAWPVLFLSFGLLVWLLDGCHACHAELRDRLKCAALTGFWFGFGYFLTGLYWIAEAFLVEPWRHGWLIPFVMTALPGGMALFYAAAAALAMMLWRPGAARDGRVELGGDQLGEVVARRRHASWRRKDAQYPLRSRTGAPGVGVCSSPSSVNPQSRFSSSSWAL